MLRCGVRCERRFARAVRALDSRHLARLFATYARSQRARSRRLAGMIERLGSDASPLDEPGDSLILLPGPTDNDIIAGCRSEQARLLGAYDHLLAHEPPPCFELTLRAQRRDVRRVACYLTALESHSGQ